MISMSRKEMIQYLKDYANIQYLIMLYPNESIGNLFSMHMLKECRFSDNNIEYYNRMKSVAASYHLFKYFSYLEDYFLNRDDFLSNNDLEELKTGYKLIEKPKDLTNKRVIQLIRNAFNHNDDLGFDKFSISKNGRYYQIQFNDIRTEKEKINNTSEKPVIIKFNADYLNKIIAIISKSKQNFLFYSFDIPDDFNMNSSNIFEELDKIKFIRYYIPKKMSKENVSYMDELSDSVIRKEKEEILKISSEMHNYLDNIDSYKKEFKLDIDQKEKIIDLISRFKDSFPKLIEKEEPYGIMYYFLKQVIPIPMLKQDLHLNQIILLDGYYNNPQISLRDISKSLVKLIYNLNADEWSEDEKSIYDAFINNCQTSKKRAIYMDSLAGEFVCLFPAITFIDSVILHYCNEEEITINGQKYNKEKIRNSFAHGRWYISKKNELIMFDADPRNVNDYDLELIGKINLKDFWDWADKYFISKDLDKELKKK